MIRLLMPFAWLAGFLVGYSKAAFRDRTTMFWIAFTLGFYFGMYR